MITGGGDQGAAQDCRRQPSAILARGRAGQACWFAGFFLEACSYASAQKVVIPEIARQRGYPGPMNTERWSRQLDELRVHGSRVPPL